VPVRGELFAQLGELQHRAQQCLSRRVERTRERFDLTVCRWPRPQAIFAPMVQRIDDVGERLPRSLAARAGSARADLNLVAGRLRSDLVGQRIARLSERLSAAWKMAELAHPERPLSKGYVRVTDRNGKTLTQARDAREAGRLTLRFGDGSLDASVEGSGRAARAVEPKRRKPYIGLQPGLFDPAED
jgi:exodeoxyribonuclease VII large subunit